MTTTTLAPHTVRNYGGNRTVSFRHDITGDVAEYRIQGGGLLIRINGGAWYAVSLRWNQGLDAEIRRLLAQ